MKYTLGLLKFLLAFQLVMCLPGCSKDGETGPPGPPGEQGIPGEQGEQGIPGSDGLDGNAYVISSDWTTLVDDDWTPTGTATARFAILNAPDITREHMDSGLILVYLLRRIPASEPVYSLPFDLNTVITMQVNEIRVGEIELKLRRIDGASFFSALSNFDFRYVIIPANIAGKNMHSDLTKMTYYELMEFLGYTY